jgi:hypothetical protein
MAAADGATPGESKPDKISPRRMVTILGALAVGMLVAGALCWLIMPEPSPRPGAAAVFPPGMAHVQPWQGIVIHHVPGLVANESGLPESRRPPNSTDRGIAYHFLIGNGTGGLGDGEIQATKHWLHQLSATGAEQRGFLSGGVNVALIGDFGAQQPTTAQINSLVELVYTLQGKLRISTNRVVLHNEIEATACPGEKFPQALFLRHLCERNRNIATD